MLSKLKPKSEFSRNVLTLMTGTTIAQAIPIAISPILTRIYTPEDFGVLALYMSVASLVAMMATGRYELAIMLPKKDEDAINIVVLSLIIAFLVSFISFVIVFIFNKQITNLLENPEISSWLYFIPITVLLTGVYQTFNYWYNRKKLYKELSTNKIVNSGINSFMTFSIGYNINGAIGLIVGVISGQIFATIFLIKKIYPDLIIIKNNINKLKIFSLMRKYRKFPILNLPTSLIDTFRLSGINILMATFFTTAILGQFSFAYKMLQAPMSLIGRSLSQVFFQRISNSDKNNLSHLINKFLKKASLIAFPIFLFIYIYAVDIFIFIFGKNWSIAGEAAEIMTPWLFFNFLTSPLSTIFLVIDKQNIVLIFSIFYMIIPLCTIIFFHNLDFLNLLKLISFLMSGMLLIFIHLTISHVKEKI